MKKKHINLKSKGEIVLGSQITAFLEQEGITQSGLANRLAINKSTLHNWVNGVSPQALLTLSRIADYFELSIDELCFGNKPREPKTDPVVIRLSLEVENSKEQKLISIPTGRS